MTQAPEPIKKTLHVPLPPEQAFDLFTKDIAKWWPVESHSISASSGQSPRDLRLDPREGGELVETTAGGDRAVWGHVTTWEPGRRLGMAWYVGRSAADATGFEVVFNPEADGTRVDLTHGGWTALGPEAAAVRSGYVMGWDGVLARFVQLSLALQPIPA